MVCADDLTELLDKVPSEIWGLIVDKIDLHYVRILSTVSKFFSNIVDYAIWRDLQLTITEDWLKKHENIFAAVTGKLKHVHSIIIKAEHHVLGDSFIFTKMFSDISKHCINLQDIDLKKYRGHVTISFMNELYRSCPKLRSVKVSTLIHKDMSFERNKVKRGPKKEDMLVDFDKTFETSSTSLEFLEMTISLPLSRVESRNYADFLHKVLTRSPNLKTLWLLNYAQQSKDFITYLMRTMILPLFDTQTPQKLTIDGSLGYY